VEPSSPGGDDDPRANSAETGGFSSGDGDRLHLRVPRRELEAGNLDSCIVAIDSY
jgi:hypothetical protein